MFEKYEKDMEAELTSVLFPDQRSRKSKDKSSKSEDDQQQNYLSTALNQVMFCLQPAIRPLITVFNLDADSNFSEAIFESICKCKLNICLIL